jgi:hypothetical protein
MCGSVSARQWQSGYTNTWVKGGRVRVITARSVQIAVSCYIGTLMSVAPILQPRFLLEIVGTGFGPLEHALTYVPCPYEHVPCMIGGGCLHPSRASRRDALFCL